MHRVENLLGVAGLIFLAMMLIRVIMVWLQKRAFFRTKGSSASDGIFDSDTNDEFTDGDATSKSHYSDFASLLQHYILPLAQAHPGWERVDGAYGIPGRTMAWFNWNGTRYALNGETQFAPLLQAEEWMQAHPGEDPLVVRPGSGPRGRLALRSEIGWKDAKAVRIETD
jgi:hypothetical protein